MPERTKVGATSLRAGTGLKILAPVPKSLVDAVIESLPAGLALMDGQGCTKKFSV
jgi:hypothetical protein